MLRFFEYLSYTSLKGAIYLFKMDVNQWCYERLGWYPFKSDPWLQPTVDFDGVQVYIDEL